MNALAQNDDDLEPLFHSAYAAIRFCLTFDGRPDRPAMNRVADKEDIYEPAKGLSGVDGAAQAGMIRSRMEALGDLPDSILIARVAPRATKCECKRPCCSGTRRNITWETAVSSIADHAKTVMRGRQVSQHIRFALVMRVFGEKIVLQELAEDQGLDRDTLGAHYARIVHWILGRKATNIYEAVEGLEAQAWANIETSLRDAGIVG